jgi:hypothetical protein
MQYEDDLLDDMLRQQRTQRQSRPQQQQQPKPQPQSKPVSKQRESLIPAGIAALMFGIPLWFVSARYSLDGWVMAVNVAAHHVHLPLFIQPVMGWWSLLLIPIGLIYSLVEVLYHPFKRMARANRVAAAVFIIACLLLHATDVGSTALSVINPTADAWPISLWIAHTWYITAVWAIILTYLPERLIIAGSQWIAGR